MMNNMNCSLIVWLLILLLAAHGGIDDLAFGVFLGLAGMAAVWALFRFYRTLIPLALIFGPMLIVPQNMNDFVYFSSHVAVYVGDMFPELLVYDPITDILGDPYILPQWYGTYVDPIVRLVPFVALFGSIGLGAFLAKRWA